LVDIEFKRHDPRKIVETHLVQFNMKWYMHENSLYEKIFRGLDLMRKFKEDSKPCLEINKLVFSFFKNTSETVFQRYYKEN